MRNIKFLALILFFFLFGNISYGENQFHFDSSAHNEDTLRDLSSLEGYWEGTCKEFNDDGNIIDEDKVCGQICFKNDKAEYSIWGQPYYFLNKNTVIDRISNDSKKQLHGGRYSIFHGLTLSIFEKVESLESDGKWYTYSSRHQVLSRTHKNQLNESYEIIEYSSDKPKIYRNTCDLERSLKPCQQSTYTCPK